MRKATRALLLLFVAASAVYLVIGKAGSRPTGGDAADGESGAAVVAYYFHGSARCTTCLTMERFAKEAVEQAFAGDIAAGRVRWRAINYDEPDNGHFVQQFELVASALVIAAPGAPPAWRKLERIWDLVGDEVAYKDYVVSEVGAVLRGGT
ncbi:MAG: hypothetical protein HY763_11725 [Planctomycetes bacterium]|nr:hypothetical protein [Planctomycetota bacterium]